MARAKPVGPRYGSRCRFALGALLRARAMTQADWMLMIDFAASHHAFDRDIVQPLRNWKLIDRIGAEFVINDDGRRFLGALPEAVDLAAPAAAREAYRMQPLSAKNRPAVRVMRPGAFDYRDVPSIHAGKPVAFRSSITVQHEDVTE